MKKITQNMLCGYGIDLSTSITRSDRWEYNTFTVDRLLSHFDSVQSTYVECFVSSNSGLHLHWSVVTEEPICVSLTIARSATEMSHLNNYWKTLLLCNTTFKILNDIFVIFNMVINNRLKCRYLSYHRNWTKSFTLWVAELVAIKCKSAV